MDITSIAYGDVKIRLSLLYSIALFIILLFYKTPRLAINKKILCIFAPFLIVSIASAFVSFYPLTSLKYLAWMFFILIFTVYPILKIGINIKHEKLIQIWINSNRFVSIFLVIEFLMLFCFEVGSIRIRL
jgi:hypothetical protein